MALEREPRSVRGSALTIGGAVMLAVTIALAVVLAFGGWFDTESQSGAASVSGTPSPPPTGDISDTALSEIPMDFALGVGLPLDKPGAEEHLWETYDPGGAWVLEPCDPTTYSTDSQRIAFGTLSYDDEDVRTWRQLGLYPNAAVAQEVMTEFRQLLDACPDLGWQRQEVRELDEGDDAMLVVTSDYTDMDGSGDDYQQVEGGGYAAIVQIENAVLIATVYLDESMPTEGAEDAGSREAREFAATLADELAALFP